MTPRPPTGRQAIYRSVGALVWVVTGIAIGSGLIDTTGHIVASLLMAAALLLASSIAHWLTGRGYER